MAFDPTPIGGPYTPSPSSHLYQRYSEEGEGVYPVPRAPCVAHVAWGREALPPCDADSFAVSKGGTFADVNL
jgi:hypothetical protein